MSRLLRRVENERTFAKYFVDGDRLGSGAFGDIYKVVSHGNGKVVAAVKRVNLKKLDSRNRAMNEQEVEPFFLILFSVFYCVFFFVQTQDGTSEKFLSSKCGRVVC